MLLWYILYSAYMISTDYFIHREIMDYGNVQNLVIIKLMIKRMVAEQENMRIPSELVPHCPVCGAPMSMNLRADNTFVEDNGWHIAADRYQTFVNRHKDLNIVYLELGVGGNTPGIIKYSFWQMTYENPNAVYICINLSEAYIPTEIKKQSIVIVDDIGEALTHIKNRFIEQTA